MTGCLLQGLQQLTGVNFIFYYGTAYFEHVVYGLSYSRPEPFYFYFYFVFMNAIWMVIPGGKSAIIKRGNEGSC